MKGNIHPRTCAAARAAATAHLQNRFWEFHDALFRQFNNLDKSRLHEIAREIGLDVAQFDVDRRAETTAASVQADIELGARLGVAATPTVFVNGRRIVRPIRAALALVIYHELDVAMRRQAKVVPTRTTPQK